jgi:hypothetical protein
LEEDAAHVGHKVLMEVDNHIAPIGGNHQGFLGQQPNPLFKYYYYVVNDSLNHILLNYTVKG